MKPSYQGAVARHLLSLYEKAVRFHTPWEEGVRYRFTAFHLHRYQRDLLTLLRSQVSPGTAFFDVGANIGYISRAVSRWMSAEGSVTAFEPNPKVFPLLQRNCAHLKNVRLHNLAVGDAEGKLTLSYRDDHTGEASLVKLPGDLVSKTSEVAVVRLESYLSRVAAGQKVFMKIDVEGFELPALRGLGSSRPEGIAAEYNPRWQRAAGFAPQEFYDWFSTRGYRLHLLASGGALMPLDGASFLGQVETTKEADSFDCIALLTIPT